MADILAVFEEFKAANDERLAQIEAKKYADPLLEAKVDKINDAITDAMAEQKKEVEDLEARLNAIGINGGGMSDEQKSEIEYKGAFNDFVRKGNINDSLSVGSDPDGGYSVPKEVDRNIASIEQDAVTMRRLCRVISLGTEDYTKIVNAHGSSSGWVGEKESRAETDTPVLKALKPYFGEIYANPAVTQKMLDDSSFNVEAWLAEELASEFADEENGKFIEGDGIGCPKGILAYSTLTTADSSRAFGVFQHVVTGYATDFIAATATVSPADALINVQQALKPVFRGNAKWLMNSATVGSVRKFKDYANGEYIWQPSIIPGQPATLLGKPVEEDEGMPSIAANAFPVMYGDFKKTYTICDRIGTRVLRDPYTNKPYVHFYTTKRVGGFATNFLSMKILKISA
ncbi:MAG: phage major capsid protein [Proteobacteria bacterium]|nr:phage major capsid protein [Pseudomonadota bacterium]